MGSAPTGLGPHRSRDAEVEAANGGNPRSADEALELHRERAELEREIDGLRNSLGAAFEELDHRRRELVELPRRIRRTAVPLGLGVGAAGLGALALGRRPPWARIALGSAAAALAIAGLALARATPRG